MAMKKEEMEDHRARYAEAMGNARAALQKGLHRSAVETALSAWDYIDGMMQCERKSGTKEFNSIEAIDLVLKYAPLLFDLSLLDRLESLLKTHRRIDKNTAASLPDKLAQARALMWAAHRLWDYLEEHPNAKQDELRQTLGGAQDQWRLIAETWEQMGLVNRAPEGRSYRLALSTRMGELVPGKCPSCGTIAEAPKAMFLEEFACAACEATVSFVILPKEDTLTGEG